MSIQPTPREGPSPFLEGTCIQLFWDSTALGYYKQCPRLYYYSIIEGWRHRAPSVHLVFGGFYASAIEFYHKSRATGTDHETSLLDTVTFSLRESWGWHSDDPNKTRETLIRTIIWYLEEFKEDNAKTVILSNSKPAVELTFKIELDYGPTGSDQPYMLSGHLDRLVEFGGTVYALDNKTTKTTLSPNYYKRFSPDNQISLYTLAGQIAFNTPARGVIIDAAQVAVGFSRFDRGIAYRRPTELDEWLRDLKVWLRRAEEDARAEHWAMNDKACTLCAFQDVCSKEPSLRPVILASNFSKEKPWNPAQKR